jgi:phosphomannomutase
MRPSGPELVAAFGDGVREQGCDVILIGLASTDGLYFASGHLNIPGAMFTASHNPAQYNGIKLCRAGAAPVGQDSGLREIREMIENDAMTAFLAASADMSSDLSNMLPVELLEPEEISDAMIWLASDAARHLTSVSLPVDAGFTQK